MKCDNLIESDILINSYTYLDTFPRNYPLIKGTRGREPKKLIFLTRLCSTLCHPCRDFNRPRLQLVQNHKLTTEKGE